MSDEVENKWSKLSEKKADEVEAAETEEDVSSADIESEELEAADITLNYPDHDALQEALTAAETKAHEEWEKAVRATAELDNVRKRAERDVANAHKYGLEKMLKELLPVIDSLEQALEAGKSTEQEGGDAMREGIELTLKLFLAALEKSHVTQISPEGEVFDPNKHEAMSMQESAEAAPGTVLVVFQKGYLLNDRVIRPARVIVAKA